MKKIIQLTTLASLLLAQVGMAAQPEKEADVSKNPLGCRNVGYKYKLNTLKIVPHTGEANQSLYFVFNRSNKPLNLYQMVPKNTTLTTYLNHTIRPKEWSVLATNLDEVNYICTLDEPHSQYGKIVNCQDTVKVCEYVRVKFGLNNRGNFWVAGSNNRGGAVGDVTRYGIIPR